MKWTLNRINYKTLYANLHYFNVAVGQCERHLSNSIYFCKYYNFVLLWNNFQVMNKKCLFQSIKK